MSMFYTEGFNEDGSSYDPDVIDVGNGTISNYVYNQLQACSELSVSFVDNFYGTINQNNYSDYIYYEDGTDYIHINDAGQQLLANRLANVIKKFPNDK